MIGTSIGAKALNMTKGVANRVARGGVAMETMARGGKYLGSGSAGRMMAGSAMGRAGKGIAAAGRYGFRHPGQMLGGAAGATAVGGYSAMRSRGSQNYPMY